MENQTCPLLLMAKMFSDCRQVRCAWWEREKRCCSILAIAEALNNVQYK